MAENSLRSWISEQLYNRILGGFAAWLTTLLETRLRQSHVELLSEIEDQARQLEVDGKIELAQQLRNTTSQQQLEQAGCLGLNFITHLQASQSDHPLNLESSEKQDANSPAKIEHQQTNEKKPRQTRRRRSGSTSKSEEPS